MYYNPYFEDRSGKFKSCLVNTIEDFLDQMPVTYFLALLWGNYVWTKREKLDTFAMRVSPSFIFWHDRLLDIYPLSYVQGFFFDMMDKAGLLDEPIMLMIEWARTIDQAKIKKEDVKIISAEEDSKKVVQIPPEDWQTEQIWDSQWINEDKKMFSQKYDIAPDLYQMREEPLVLNKNPKAPRRWLRFLVFNPKEERSLT